MTDAEAACQLAQMLTALDGMIDAEPAELFDNDDVHAAALHLRQLLDMRLCVKE